MSPMKTYLLLCFILAPLLVTAQEDFYSGLYIGIPEADKREFPALSMEIPFPHFNLPEVNIFFRDEERKINMLGIVARERHLKEKYNEYETPNFLRKRNEGIHQVRDNVHLYNRASNYDFYTGKLKNP